MNFVTPSGFRDILADEACRREDIIRDVQQLFAERGYQPVETPTLEVMDVMEAGGRGYSAPFKFFDSGGDLLVMRPDVTMQIARMCATRLEQSTDPLRFRYTQRVFREADLDAQAVSRETTQIGIECIGEAGLDADIEVISLLAEALQRSGVANFTLSVATVEVLRALLLRSGGAQAWQDDVLDAYHASDYVKLEALTSIGDDGVCCADANVDADVACAVRGLFLVRGKREAIDRARDLVKGLIDADALDDFGTTYDKLAERGLGKRLFVDFSVMSSFDYYTGIVFEAFSPYAATPLGSGGRYDHMLAAYGADRPAAGFAFSLELAMSAGDAEEREACSSRDGKDSPSRPLRIAVPKGSLNEGTIACLADAGLDVDGLDDPGRQLIVKTTGIDYIIVRPSDAPAFVALGAADCGICGKDSLLEADAGVVELVDLKYGACRFVVAELEGSNDAIEERYRKLGSIRVATKYPRVAAEYYARTGYQVDIVKLHGNIELAPLSNIAERIFDITATGTTLRENNLCIVDEVVSSTARFFANTCAFRTDERIMQLADTLRSRVDEAKGA